MNKSTAPADEIWSILKEVAAGHKEAERKRKEARREMEEIRASLVNKKDFKPKAFN